MRLSKSIFSQLTSVTATSLLLACSCSTESKSEGESALSENEEERIDSPLIPGSDPEPEEETFHVSNDIAMRVRSVAAAINEGEVIDSTDYNFSGVLTDGMGAPLFTDFKGLPGEWEVNVINSKEVKIRNIGVGDLVPGSLMEYVRASINATDTSDVTPDLEMIDSYDNGDARVEVYSYGRTSVQVETRPETLPTGEVGPLLEITLRCDTIPNTDMKS